MRHTRALLSYAQLLISFYFINRCDTQFHQDDYHVVQDRIVIETYNKSLVDKLEAIAYKYNDTLEMKAIKISVQFAGEVKEKLVLRVKAFKFVAEEYRQLPFDFAIDLCESYGNMGSMNPFGVQTGIKLSNFRGCPFLAKKFYHVDNWVIEEEKFLPHIPSGQYSLKITGYADDDIFIFEGSWFGQLVSKGGGKKKRRRH